MSSTIIWIMTIMWPTPMMMPGTTPWVIVVVMRITPSPIHRKAPSPGVVIAIIVSIIIIPGVTPGWKGIGVIAINIYIPIPVVEIHHVVI